VISDSACLGSEPSLGAGCPSGMADGMLSRLVPAAAEPCRVQDHRQIPFIARSATNAVSALIHRSSQTGGSVAALRFHTVHGAGLPRDTLYAGLASILTDGLLWGAPRSI
jgi:dTDP-L-rhamnose 4-epimerase